MKADTKTIILDVAERLFADSGFIATSLRDITSEANVNLASVNYHFGSKEALLAAVMERRFRPINEARLQLLDKLEAHANNKTIALQQIIEALLIPPFQKQMEWGKSGEKFLKLVGHIHSENNDEIRVLLLKQFETVRERFTKAFERALPNLEPSEIHLRFAFLIGAMAFTMMGTITSSNPNKSQEPEQLLASLIRFCVGGMTASSSASMSSSIVLNGDSK